MEHRRYYVLTGGALGFVGGPLLLLLTQLVAGQSYFWKNAPLLLLAFPWLVPVFFGALTVIGMIVGHYYGVAKKKNHLKSFSFCVGLLFLALYGWGLFQILVVYQEVGKVYASAQSPQDCVGFLKTSVRGFSTDSCYFSLAKKKNDVKLCDLIDPRRTSTTNEGKKIYLIAKCYKEVASIMPGPEVCEKITEIETNGKKDATDYLLFAKSECYQSMYKLQASTNPLVCEKTDQFRPFDEPDKIARWKNECYAGIFMCEKVVDPEEQSSCYYKRAVEGTTIEEISGCAQVSPLEERNNCYDSVSYDIDPQWSCPYITGDQSLMDQCFSERYKRRVWSSGNQLVCGNIPNAVLRAECYVLAEEKIPDTTTVSFCDSLNGTAEVKSECRDYFYFRQSRFDDNASCEKIKSVDKKKECHERWGE